MSLVELYGTYFGSFGNDSKMYKEFTIDVDNKLSELILCFNGSRFNLSSTENVVIAEKVMGKLFSIIISLLGLAFFILLIFTIAFIQIYF